MYLRKREHNVYKAGCFVVFWVETWMGRLGTTVTLPGRLYLKEAHISSSPVIDGLVSIPHDGHPLPQPVGGAIAGEGKQQSILSVSHVLELIQLQHQTSSLHASGSACMHLKSRMQALAACQFASEQGLILAQSKNECTMV